MMVHVFGDRLTRFVLSKWAVWLAMFIAVALGMLAGLFGGAPAATVSPLAASSAPRCPTVDTLSAQVRTTVAVSHGVLAVNSKAHIEATDLVLPDDARQMTNSQTQDALAHCLIGEPATIEQVTFRSNKTVIDLALRPRVAYEYNGY